MCTAGVPVSPSKVTHGIWMRGGVKSFVAKSSFKSFVLHSCAALNTFPLQTVDLWSFVRFRFSSAFWKKKKNIWFIPVVPFINLLLVTDSLFLRAGHSYWDVSRVKQSMVSLDTFFGPLSAKPFLRRVRCREFDATPPWQRKHNPLVRMEEQTYIVVSAGGECASMNPHVPVHVVLVSGHMHSIWPAKGSYSAADLHTKPSHTTNIMDSHPLLSCPV